MIKRRKRMSTHPMDYLREEYLEPLGVTQGELYKSLNLGSKTLSELYQGKRGMSVHVAKKFSRLTGVSAKKLLKMQVEFDLEQDDMNYNIKPLVVPHNTKMMINLMNCSLKELKDLFKVKSTKKQSELSRMLFENVPLNKTVQYMRDSKIGLSHLKHLYSEYLKLDGAKRKPSFEKLFADDDVTAVAKMCDNENYFENPREFEKYVFNRLSMLHNKKLLVKLVHNRDKPEQVRKRAAYLYEFVTGEELKVEFSNTPVRLFAKSNRVAMKMPERYSVVAGLDHKRFDQFMKTGNF
jgi:addiction module HigA family antidote